MGKSSVQRVVASAPSAPRYCRSLRFVGAALALLMLLPIASSSSAQARDLQGRLGLGYNNEFVNHVPGVSLKYGLTRDLAAELVVGAATTSPTSSATGVKLFKNLFYETNLNFYFMLGGGLLSQSGKSGAEFLGGFGAEFFIPGIESLGFAVETGGTLDNLGGSMVLRTLGVSFLDAGIHFYF